MFKYFVISTRFLFLRLLIKKGSVLALLVSLESIVMFLSITLFISSECLFVVLLIIRIGACEAALGLAVIVALVRSKGAQNLII